jgi:hypothetical protein
MQHLQLTHVNPNAELDRCLVLEGPSAKDLSKVEGDIACRYLGAEGVAHHCPTEAGYFEDDCVGGL